MSNSWIKEAKTLARTDTTEEKEFKDLLLMPSENPLRSICLVRL